MGFVTVTWVRYGLVGKGSFGYTFWLKQLHPSTKKANFLHMAVKSAIMSKSSSLKHEKGILCDLTASPYVVRYYGDEVTELDNGKKIYNLLLEFCSGRSLDHKIKMSSGCGLPESDVRVCTCDIVRALKYIHCRDYVHCDIKPSDILLVPGTRERSGGFGAEIANFGLAKPEYEDEDNDSSGRRGTYRCVSPKLVKVNILGWETDSWAVMLNGKPPWPARITQHDLVHKIGYGKDMPCVTPIISEDAQNF